MMQNAALVINIEQAVAVATFLVTGNKTHFICATDETAVGKNIRRMGSNQRDYACYLGN